MATPVSLVEKRGVRYFLKVLAAESYNFEYTKWRLLFFFVNTSAVDSIMLGTPSESSLLGLHLARVVTFLHSKVPVWESRPIGSLSCT